MYVKINKSERIDHKTFLLAGTIGKIIKTIKEFSVIEVMEIDKQKEDISIQVGQTIVVPNKDTVSFDKEYKDILNKQQLLKQITNIDNEIAYMLKVRQVAEIAYNKPFSEEV
jgi:hypothetical protein